MYKLLWARYCEPYVGMAQFQNFKCVNLKSRYQHLHGDIIATEQMLASKSTVVYIEQLIEPAPVCST